MRALSRQGEDLLQTQLQQQNPPHDTTDTLAREARQAVLDTIAKQREVVEQTIKQHPAARPNCVLDTGEIGTMMEDASQASGRL